MTLCPVCSFTLDGPLHRDFCKARDAIRVEHRADGSRVVVLRSSSSSSQFPNAQSADAVHEHAVGCEHDR